MTKEQALQFKERWRAVNRLISEEIRKTPPDLKAKQISSAFQAARLMRLVSSQDHPFERWQLLREKYDV